MATSVGVISLPEKRHLSWRAAVAMAAVTAVVAGAAFAAGWGARSGSSTQTNDVSRPAVLVPVDPAIRMSGIENPSIGAAVSGPALSPGIEFSGIENPSVAASLNLGAGLTYSGYENPSSAWVFSGSSSGQAPGITKNCQTTERNIC